MTDVNGIWIGRRESLYVVAICLAIGVSSGLAFGLEGGNQLVYLPPGLRLVDPGFLQNDWWATETTAYHLAFSYLVAALAQLQLLPWALAVGNICLIAATYWCVFKLIQAFWRTHAFVIWLLFLFLYVGITRSESVAASYLFDAELQASTIASFATVAAIFFFVTGRSLLSGIALALAGLMHTNFLFLGLLCFGIAHLFISGAATMGPSRLIRRGVMQLAPSLVVLGIQLPLIFTVAGYDLPDGIRAQAQQILVEIAAPHHYQPTRFLADFIPLIGWNLAGVSLLRSLPGDVRLCRNFEAIYLSLLLVIVIGTLLTTVVYIDFVSRIFVWRMAPFATMCAQIVIAFATYRILTGNAAAMPVVFRSRWIWGVGVGLLTIAAFYSRRLSMFDPRMLLGAAALIAIPVVYFRVNFQPHRQSRTLGNSKIVALLLAALIFARAPTFLSFANGHVDISRNFNLIRLPAMDRSRYDLYDWALTTERGSRFLIPPMLSGFRLHAQRAVFVDWKGRPFKPDELVEWHRRMKIITGLDTWQRLDELDPAYDALDDAQVTSIVDTYNIDYAVFHSHGGSSHGSTIGDVVFENDVFVVVKVRSGVADAGHDAALLD